MNATTGFTSDTDYSAVTTAGAGIDLLLALIPNPDAPHGTGAAQGGTHGYLDEISPAAAVQLRVELTALKDVVGTFDAPA